MRKIVFVGNCQGRRLQVLYTDQFSRAMGDTTDFLVSYEPFTERARDILLSADIVVAQAIDSEHSISVASLDLKAPIIWFPNITAVFLWPYSGVEHIHNRKLPHFPDGPFGREFGDRWLNRKIQQGVPAPDIVKAYLDLDIAKVTNLDRMFELVIDRARQRDLRTGFAATAIIERHLTDQKLFMTPANLELPLFNHLAGGVYERLGVASAEIERVLNGLWRTPFPVIDLPVHPSVAHHFGLKFISEDTRYRVSSGERVSFAEWVDRYVRFDWNDTLLRATAKAGHIRKYDAEAEDTIKLLNDGLAGSSGSAAGYASLGHLLLLKGEGDEALRLMQQAEAFDPSNPQLAVTAAHLLAETGALEAAEQRLVELTVKWPRYSVVWARLAHIRERLGDGPGAVAAIQRAVQLDPRDAQTLGQRAGMVRRFGTPDGAREAFAQAVLAAPDDAALHSALALLEAARERFPEALRLVSRAIELEPANFEFVTQKADIARKAVGTGGEADVAQAEAAIRDLIVLQPQNMQLRMSLVDLLIASGRKDAAVQACRDCLERKPDSVSMRIQVAGQFAAAGWLPEAVSMYRETIGLDWNHAGLFSGLAQVLLRQNDLAGAALALRRAAQLRPQDVEIGCRLATILMQDGDAVGAENVLKETIRHAPDRTQPWSSLALVFIRQRKLEDALHAADQAITLDASNPHLVARRAHILSEMGDFEDAERELRDVIARVPNAGGLYATLGTVLLRQGRRGDAEAVFRQALEVEPSNTTARYHLERLADGLVVAMAGA